MRRRVARGSKSERVAVLLRTRGREYVLRREGGHPLRDPTLEELIGKTIECEGSIHEYVLIMSRWHVVG
ncbi:MAG TPA: hypothetical protein VGT40_02370 [Methylomirabilota bacterium]|nr:hypothetical protein [Methylomirabilota bacterium]